MKTKNWSVFAALVVLAVVQVHSFGTQTADADSGLVLAEQVCDGPRVDVNFNYPAMSTYGIAAWLDISLFDNGWAPNTFRGAPLLTNPPRGGLMAGGLTNLLSDTFHVARLNLLRFDGTWQATETIRFTTRHCDPTAPYRQMPAYSGPGTFGFSPIPSDGSEVIPIGGAMYNVCSPTTVYAYVRVPDLASLQAANVRTTWSIQNGEVIATDPAFDIVGGLVRFALPTPGPARYLLDVVPEDQQPLDSVLVAVCA